MTRSRMTAEERSQRALELITEAHAIVDRSDAEGDRPLTLFEQRQIRAKQAEADRLLAQAKG